VRLRELGPRDDETTRQWFGYLAYSTMAEMAMRVPYRWGERLAPLAGWVFHRVARRTRARVTANLARVLGQPAGSPLVDAATRRGFETYARYWFEAFAIRTLPGEDFLRRFRSVGREHIEAALAAGIGGVLALPHLGNWDAAGRWVALSGWPMSAVAEELKPRRMFDLFYRHRLALGMGIVPLTSDRKAAEECVRLLSANELICLVADRDLTGRGVDVEMFGERTRLPAGPALLSLATGAPLIPTAVYHTDDGGWLCVIQPPLTTDRTGDMREDVTRLTRALAAAFERSIASAPGDWHMFQDYWAPPAVSAEARQPGGASSPATAPAPASA
jgi:lauroyl/myristoyl acyltransferase